MKYLEFIAKLTVFTLMGVLLGAIYDPRLAVLLGILGAIYDPRLAVLLGILGAAIFLREFLNGKQPP